MSVRPWKHRLVLAAASITLVAGTVLMPTGAYAALTPRNTVGGLTTSGHRDTGDDWWGHRHHHSLHWPWHHKHLGFRLHHRHWWQLLRW